MITQSIFNIQNLDLLSVGVAVASIIVLGFTVYFNDKESITNKTFLLLSIFATLWSVSNYFSYKIKPLEFNQVIWLLRSVIFFAIFFAFYLFKFMYVFPSRKVYFPQIYNIFALPLTVVVAFLTLTPLIFSSISSISSSGEIASIEKGPAIVLFGIFVLFFDLGAIFMLVRRTLKAKTENKKKFYLVLLGTAITFTLILIFNFILPAFFDNPKFVPFGAFFIFPFIAFTTYSILRHHLLNVKILSTSILTFILSIVTFIEIILSKDVLTLIFRSGVFLLVLAFGILLIRSVMREVRQRERLEVLSKELETANERLKELDKLKTEFLSFASHQLRSPLTAIKGYASMLLENSYGALEEKAREPINRVMESTNHLVKLIEDFLNVSKIEQGGMKYVFAKTDMEVLLRELTNELSVAAEKKGLKLTFETDGKVGYYANADQEKLRQVLLNFIDNAIKYTPAAMNTGQQGFVKIRLEKTPNRKARVSVSDSGVGMSEETKNRLFEKFARGEEGQKVNTGGSGLGLYLAKQIVSAHGGRIWAESPGPNLGSTFSIELSLQ